MQARGLVAGARGLGWGESPFAPRPYNLYHFMGVDSDDETFRGVVAISIRRPIKFPIQGRNLTRNNS